MRMIRGYISLARRYKGDSCHMGDTPWHFSTSRDFGLWSLSVHGFGLRFEVIGPFRFALRKVA